MFFAISLAFAAEDHTNHYADAEGSKDNITVEVKDAWSRETEAKFKVVVRNDGPDYVVLRAEKFGATFGDKRFDGKDKQTVVEPGTKAGTVVELAGSGMHQDSFTLHPDGITVVSADAPVIAAPDFRLPIEQKSFEAGPFKCNLAGKVKKTTDDMTASWKCIYTGKGVGLVDRSQLQVRLEDGQLFAPEKSGNGVKAVMPGDSVKIGGSWAIERKVIDMQFGTFWVQWNDTFREGKEKDFPMDAMTVKVDVGLTAEKNK